MRPSLKLCVLCPSLPCRSGLISSILSFRQRFMEEEAEPINWDTV